MWTERCAVRSRGRPRFRKERGWPATWLLSGTSPVVPRPITPGGSHRSATSLRRGEHDRPGRTDDVRGGTSLTLDVREPPRSSRHTSGGLGAAQSVTPGQRRSFWYAVALRPMLVVRVRASTGRTALGARRCSSGARGLKPWSLLYGATNAVRHGTKLRHRCRRASRRRSAHAHPRRQPCRYRELCRAERSETTGPRLGSERTRAAMQSRGGRPRSSRSTTSGERCARESKVRRGDPRDVFAQEGELDGRERPGHAEGPRRVIRRGPAVTSRGRSTRIAPGDTCGPRRGCGEGHQWWCVWWGWLGVPAVSYSPTTCRSQYHRRWRA